KAATAYHPKMWGEILGETSMGVVYKKMMGKTKGKGKK
ncbi:MAG: hypothetical protein RLZZ156_2900, partial [Deinococcota bacterium]